MVDLLGERDTYLKQVDAAFPGARIVARGNEIVIEDFGEAAAGEMIQTVFDELLTLIQEGEPLDEDRVSRVIEMVKQDVPSPSGVFTDSRSLETFLMSSGVITSLAGALAGGGSVRRAAAVRPPW